MKKFFKVVIILLLVQHGWAAIVIETAEGVKLVNQKDTVYTLSMDENNHSFLTKTAILKVSGVSVEPNIASFGTSTMFIYEFEKEVDKYVLYSNQSFDYEQQQQRSYKFNIIESSEIITIVFNINNIDDESPSLTSPQCTLNENTVYNLENSTCSCTLMDPDGWLDKTTFTILPGSSGTEPYIFDMGFKVKPTDTTYSSDVFIYLKDDKQLDYENISFYLFNISAKDSANHPTTPSEVLAIINVGDMRDTPPVWTSMIAFEQFKEQEEKTFTVKARDGDVGINKEISYAVISQDDSDADYVSIDKKLGTIHVKPIDRDKNDILMYNFKIAAYVTEEEEWITYQNISFYIIDIDNNPPLVKWVNVTNGPNTIFDGSTDKLVDLKFLENYMGNLNTTIFIKDIDTGENAQFEVELEKIEGSKIDHTLAFMVVPNVGYRNGSFQITVLNATYLDYENPDWRKMKFNVLTTGVLDPEKKDRMAVNIDLIDYNDEIPKFEKDGYSVTIKETAAINEFITQVLATDRDAEDKILNHSLVGSTYTQQVLRIENDTGKIYVKSEKAFDYDTVNPVFVQVKATDKVGHTATVPLTINLEDVNNKAPTINAGDPISVKENQEKGTKLVSNITASDVDTTADLIVEINWSESYALKNSRRLDMKNETIWSQVEFLDVSSTGSGRNIEIELVVNDATNKILAPDYELFDSLYLSLNVTDLNTDKNFLDQKSTSAIILIGIIDINDNTPFFENVTVDNRTVEENADAKTSVGSIKAIDLDVTDTVTYDCKPESSSFDWLDIDTDKGTFTVKEGIQIDADTYQTYYFNYSCTASDNDMTHTSDPVTVNFYILDRNNKIPQTNIQPDEQIHLLEKPENDYLVKTIGTHDDDRDPPFHGVECRFSDTKTTCYQKFYISNNEIRVKIGTDIDRDLKEKNFTCSITCEDNQLRWRSEGVKSTTADFIIILDDRNDHTPELDMENIKTSESKIKGDTIFYIVATDIDEGKNADIDFKLLSVKSVKDERDITSMFSLVRGEDYLVDSTHQRASLIAKEDLKGYYGTYLVIMELSDRGDIPNVLSNANRTLTINKYNFEAPYIIYPTANSYFTLLSTQEPNSPLAIFRSTENLKDFRASNSSEGGSCEKWDISFSLEQLSPATDTIFKFSRKEKCVYQLQVNDKFNSDEVLQVAEYKLQIKAQIMKDEDYLRDEETKEAPDYSVTNISIKFAENAQKPYWKNPVASLSAQEAKVPQVLKLNQIAVYDVDEGLAAYYFLITKNSTIEDIFEVNSNTGDVSVVNQFYYDFDKEFQFQILASNDTKPFNDRPNSHLSVTVTVLPANIRPPQFVSEFFFGAILPGFLEGTPIITAEATDPDFVDRNKLTYRIKDKIVAVGSGLNNIQNPAFEVGKTTGKISLRFLVESTMSGYFSFDICVADEEDQFGNGPHEVCTKVTIFIITEDKTVDFRFYNNITEVQDNEKQLLDTMTDVIGIRAYRQSFQNQTSDDGLLTIARLYFINSTITNFYQNTLYQDETPVMAVDSKVIMRLVSNYGTYSKLQADLRVYKLMLVPFPASAAEDDGQLQAWLIGTSAVLGALCIVLLGIFVFKVQQLKRTISNLTARKFGSQESGMNRLGIAAPTTNKHAVEGSNPIFNIEDMKKPKDMADFETHSIRSGDSDLIGVEDNPEFDYSFDPTDDKTTYL